MGRFLVFVGLVLAAVVVAHFLQGFETELTGYYSGRGTSQQRSDAAWETGKRQAESGAWMVLGLCLSGGLILAGRRMIAAEKTPRDSVPVSAVAVPEREQDRSSNPFKRGEVSETVLPRGDFHKKRNKFRKTIERPNSDGY